MFNAEVGSTALYLLSSSAEPSALQSFPSYQSFCAMQKYPISVITVHLHFRNFSAEQQWHNLLMVHLFKNSTFLPQFHQTVFQATCYLQWNTVCYTSWRSNCLQSYFHSLRKNKSFMDCSFLSGHLSLIFKGYLLKFYMNWAIQLSVHKTKSQDVAYLVLGNFQLIRSTMSPDSHSGFSECISSYIKYIRNKGTCYFQFNPDSSHFKFYLLQPFTLDLGS